MNEEEKKDILFDIDMKLYAEFNDKFCEINDHLGDVYTYKDLEDIEKAEKEKEIELLREAIEKQQKQKQKQNKLIELHDMWEEKDLIYENRKLENQLEEQEKVIDEMAEYLADCEFDECCAEVPEPCLGCSWEDYEPHTNCIKQYFINKVKENKE